MLLAPLNMTAERALFSGRPPSGGEHAGPADDVIEADVQGSKYQQAVVVSYSSPRPPCSG